MQKRWVGGCRLSDPTESPPSEFWEEVCKSHLLNGESMGISEDVLVISGSRLLLWLSYDVPPTHGRDSFSSVSSLWPGPWSTKSLWLLLYKVSLSPPPKHPSMLGSLIQVLPYTIWNYLVSRLCLWWFFEYSLKKKQNYSFSMDTLSKEQKSIYPPPPRVHDMPHSSLFTACDVLCCVWVWPSLTVCLCSPA